MASVRIDIHYIKELKPDIGGKGVLLTIPTSIAPRYGNTPMWMRESLARNNAKLSRGMKIRVEVSAPSPILQLNSLTHIIETRFGSRDNVAVANDLDDLVSGVPSGSVHDSTKAQATLSRATPLLERDFVLLINVKGNDLLAPRALMEHSLTHPNNSAMKLSFTPRDLLAPKLPKNELKGEIIFVADRSGSMYDKIGALKRSLQKFLSMLPEGSCHFNICSFGSTSDLLWKKSVKCNKENIQTAQQFLDSACNANMGGTELKYAIQKSVESRRIEGNVPTQIVVLTDGEVWDYNETIRYVQETRKKHGDKVRFFSLGIGDEVSHQLIEDIGRFGGGFAEVIPTTSDSPATWDERVDRMLKGALTPYTWDCQFRLGSAKDNSESTTPKGENAATFVQAPLRLPSLHLFARSTLYFLFETGDPPFDTVYITATSSNGVKVEHTLPIEHVQVPTPRIHYLAAKAVLKELEKGAHPGGPAKTQAECERLGMEWSIIGRYTSFVGVNQSNGKGSLTRVYKADRLDFDGLNQPRNPGLPPYFRWPTLPWLDRSTPYFDGGDDDDDDEDDDRPGPSGRRTSSSRKSGTRFCGGMNFSGYPRRKHDDDDDDEPGDGHDGWHGGSSRFAHHTNGNSGSGSFSSSGAVDASHTGVGTSVNWITKAAFASFDDGLSFIPKPMNIIWPAFHSANHSGRKTFASSVLGSYHDEPWIWSHQSIPALSYLDHQAIKHLLSAQLPYGAFDLDMRGKSEAKLWLLAAFKPSIIEEIGSWLETNLGG